MFVFVSRYTNMAFRTNYIRNKAMNQPYVKTGKHFQIC